VEFTQGRTVRIVASLLMLAAVTQSIYTAQYLQAPDVDRKLLWGMEGLLFVVLAAFAGSALAMAKRHRLGFSAIVCAAVLNVVQVAVGLTLFAPFGAMAKANAEFAGVASAVVALSFFIYNCAKMLLGLAAVVFGMARLNAGSKLLGGATALVGTVACVANTLVMMFGLDGFFPSPIAGGSGVVATLLLALCLFGVASEE
jgi:hypothetical protein